MGLLRMVLFYLRSVSMTRRAELLSSGQAKRFASRLIPSNSVVAESVLELIYAKI